MKISVMLSCLIAISCAIPSISEVYSRNVLTIGTEPESQQILDNKNVNLLKRVTRQLVGVNVSPFGVGVGVGPIRVAVPLSPFGAPARGVPFGVPGRPEPFGVPNYPAYPVYPEYRYQNEYQNRYRYNYNY